MKSPEQWSRRIPFDKSDENELPKYDKPLALLNYSMCVFFLSCETPFSPTDDGDGDTGKPEEPPPPCVILSEGTLEMQPLAVGNYWVYHTWYLSKELVTIRREEITSSHEFECEQGTLKAFGFQRFEHTQNRPSIPGAEWLIANSDRGMEGVGAISKSDTALLVSPRYKFPAELK